jgi:6-pyruvoyltetrahydropterin/6-carboxytetrahydropterin synthase
MSEPVFEITQAAHFDAAHFLAVGPEGSVYRRMHGHSFKVEATVRGQAHGPIGWVADFASLEDALKAIAQDLDHALLNEKPGLENPTLERLCVYFADSLKPTFPGLCRITVSRPSVGESCSLAL